MSLVVATSCDDDARKEPGAAPSASATATAAPVPPGLDGLSVKSGGEPVTLRSALAYSRASSVITLVLSSESLGCSAVAAPNEASAALADGETRLVLEIVPELQKGGAERRLIRAKAFDGPASGELTGLELVDGDVASKVRARFAGSVTSPAGRTLELSGAVTAEPCGQLPAEAGGEPVAQPELSLSVAGREMGITGAVLRARPEGRWALELSTAANTCAGDSPVGDVELRLTGTLEPPRVDAAYLYGEILGEHESRRDLEPDQVAISFGSQEGDAVPVEVKGEFDHDGYRVTVSGKASARPCSE